MNRIFAAVLLVLNFTSAAWADVAAWPPVKEKDSIFTERKLDTFKHGIKPEWGYAAPQQDTFLVLHPKQERKHAPLYVVLHSAGHDVHSCLACTAKVGNHDIYHAPADFFALYLDCRANKGDWWWGSDQYKESEVSPTDKRVIDTVKWVIEQYGLDANRVYLCGNSMGGSGTLGIGMRHGDVFAAIKANVPARVEHVSRRMYLPPLTVPAGVTLPDPPIVVDYSGTNDGWSKGHDAFAQAMNERKYAFYFYWGPFGHANNHANIMKVNDLINSFDWLSVKKNEAVAGSSDGDEAGPGECVLSLEEFVRHGDGDRDFAVPRHVVGSFDKLYDSRRSNRRRQPATAAEFEGRAGRKTPLVVRQSRWRDSSRRRRLHYRSAAANHGRTADATYSKGKLTQRAERAGLSLGVDRLPRERRLLQDANQLRRRHAQRFGRRREIEFMHNDPIESLG